MTLLQVPIILLQAAIGLGLLIMAVTILSVFGGIPLLAFIFLRVSFNRLKHKNNGGESTRMQEIIVWTGSIVASIVIVVGFLFWFVRFWANNFSETN